MKQLFLLVPFCLLSIAAAIGQKTVTRSLSSFDHLNISGNFEKVILKEGSTEGVTLEVSGIDPENIITEVKQNSLNVWNKKSGYYSFKAVLTITYRQLNEISNSGSSDIYTYSPIKGSALQLNMSGSGDFTGQVDVDKFDIAISGSGDIKVKGRADQQDFAISGSGDIKAQELKGKSAEVAISGSGDVVIAVDGPVHSTVSGSGKVKNVR